MAVGRAPSLLPDIWIKYRVIRKWSEMTKLPLLLKKGMQELLNSAMVK